MHKCEFCNAMFQPRAQVKRPRACPNCQQLRQRKNEKDWRNKQIDIDGAAIARTFREGRKTLFEKVTQQLLALLKTGGEFHHRLFDPEYLRSILLAGLSQLGVRFVNKFWVP